MNRKIQLLLGIFISCAFLSAEEVTKVLQNGLNDYAGCKDTYLYRIGDDPSSVDKNFHDNPYLMTAN